MHDSYAGFSGNNLSDGYTLRDTQIYLDKEINFSNLKLNFSASYSDDGDGLQGQVSNISALNRDNIYVSNNLSWILPHNVDMGCGLNGGFYFRYADVTDYSSGDIEDWVRFCGLMTFSPDFYAKWEGNAFSVSMKGEYDLNWDAAGTVSDYAYNSRFEPEIDFSWHNDRVNLYAELAYVIGNCLNDNSFIIPFTLGLDGSFPVYFSDRKLALTLKGGINSELPSVSELEKTYKFTGFSFLPSESTNVFTNFEITIPLKTSFTTSVTMDYFKSILGNGVWQPLYEGTLVNGLYIYSQQDMERFVTKLDFTYRHKILALSVIWRASWFDKLCLENEQNLGLNLALHSHTGKWGIDFESYYAFDAEDKTPFVNLQGFIQLTPAVRAAIETEDLLKLLVSEERIYAGTYITTGGSVTLLFKFLL